MSALDETALSFVTQRQRDAFLRPVPFLSPCGALPAPSTAPPLPQTEDAALHALRGLHPAPLLSPRDYKAHFTSLLLAEEWRRRGDVPRADLTRRIAVQQRAPEAPLLTAAAAPPSAHTWEAFTPARGCFTVLHVPGVSEGRPYLEPGALVRFRPAHGSHSGRTFMQLEQAFALQGAARSANPQDPLFQELCARQMEPLRGDIEVRGVVTHIDVNTEAVTVELPTRFRPNVCLRCWAQGARSPAVFAPACSHASLCFRHACEVNLIAQTRGVPYQCPLCFEFTSWGQMLLAVAPPDAPYDAEVLKNTCPMLRVALDNGVGLPRGSLLALIDERSGQSLWEDSRFFINATWHIRFEDPRTSLAQMRAAVGELPVFDAVVPQPVYRRLFSGLGTVVPRSGTGGVDDLVSASEVREAWERLAGGGAYCGGGGGGGGGGGTSDEEEGVSKLRALAWLRLAVVRASCVCLRKYIFDDRVAPTPPASVLAGALAAHRAALEGAAHTLDSLPRDAPALAQLALPVRPHHFTDRNLDLEQRSVVNALVLGAFGEVPYLLIGPAGSGKTRVLAEAVAQLLLAGRRVLLCAGSEPATDLLLLSFIRSRGALLKDMGLAGAAVVEQVERHKAVDAAARATTARTAAAARVNPEENEPPSPDTPPPPPPPLSAVLRLNPLSRRPEALVDRALLPFSPSAVASALGAFVAPSPEVLRRSRIVAASLTGGLPLLRELGGAPFDYVLVDESSQAMEPEALLAVLQACGTADARLVLTGDPRQLGPEVRSQRAVAKGLGVSMQERLLAGRAEGWRAAGAGGGAFLLPTAGGGGGGGAAGEGGAELEDDHAAHVTNALDTVRDLQKTLRECAGGAPLAPICARDTAPQPPVPPLPPAPPAPAPPAPGPSLTPKDYCAAARTAHARLSAPWPCAACTYRNPGQRDTCEICCTPNPVLRQVLAEAFPKMPCVLGRPIGDKMDPRRCPSCIKQCASPAAVLQHWAQKHTQSSAAAGSAVNMCAFCSRRVHVSGPFDDPAPLRAHVRLCVVEVQSALKAVREEAAQFRAGVQAKHLVWRRPDEGPPYGQGGAVAAAAAEPDEELTESLAEAEALRVAHLIRVYDEAPVELIRLLRCLEARRGLPTSEPNTHPLAPVRIAFSSTLTSVFRCHQGILNIAARLFYADIPLLSRANAEATQACRGFTLLHRAAAGYCGGGGGAAEGGGGGKAGEEDSFGAAFPVVALGVEGDDFNSDPFMEKERYENPGEAAAVVWAVQLLLAESAAEAHHEAPAPTRAWLPHAGVEVTLPAVPPPPRTLALRAEDIGVIAPFRSAVVALRAALRAAKLPAVSVGVPSVFQGQEKRVIIISTVLSTNCGVRLMARRKAQQEAFGPLRGAPSAAAGGEVAVAAPAAPAYSCGGGGSGSGGPCPPPSSAGVGLLSTKRVGWASAIPLGASSVTPLGLFCDPRGFNVSLTRAQSLLLCVGDPKVWAMDKWWAAFLQMCVDKHAYVGYEGTKLPEGFRPQQGLGLL
jgi:hypothetical protein